MVSIISISIFIVLILISTIVESKDNYIYAVTSNVNPTQGQDIYVFDVTSSTPIFNQTVIVPYQIEQILSANKFFNTITFLGLENNGNNKVIIEFNTKTGETKLKSSVNDNAIQQLDSANQPIIQIEKSIYQVGRINGLVYPSLLKWDFENEKLDILTLVLSYYDVNSNVYPFVAYGRNEFYLTFQSNITSIDGSTSIIKFSHDYPQGESKTYYDINGLNGVDIKMLFTDSKDNLYAIKTSSKYQSSAVEVCKIDFQISECQTQVTVPLGYGYSNERYIPFFLNSDSTSLIFLADSFESPNKVLAHIFDISTWTTKTVTLDNQWSRDSVYSYSYFTMI